jgi:hypothetical protein
MRYSKLSSSDLNHAIADTKAAVERAHNLLKALRRVSNVKAFQKLESSTFKLIQKLEREARKLERAMEKEHPAASDSSQAASGALRASPPVGNFLGIECFHEKRANAPERKRSRAAGLSTPRLFTRSPRRRGRATSVVFRDQELSQS